MRQMFGSGWTSQYGEVPNDAWLDLIAKLTEKQLLRGLNETAKAAREFPPNMTIFRALCEGGTDGNCRTHHEAYKQLSPDPPETKEHAQQRIERNQHHAQGLLKKLKGAA